MTSIEPKPINYGMFIMPFHPPDKPLSRCFDEDIELVVLAEELGFDEFWIGEHHTMRYESIVVPEVFIGRLLGEARSSPGLSQPTPPGVRSHSAGISRPPLEGTVKFFVSVRGALLPTRSFTDWTPSLGAP